ncbi:Molybdopterin synthase sulfur carrier subunit [Gemmata sp. SH-PL17]|uniref:molybdopterin converting factor subunit 1 n=1 Tax=Gemmata sp. SH-PL17 TaxID=1630693 RepID=UPI00078C4A63|nr:molybdopterin converting factor subunit 1 [Gemmata sp. SH-PL17]AMV30281.1 Molybdopterin synthase sulfur carrier subunit [Gemmata sp. SH-PL17]
MTFTVKLFAAMRDLAGSDTVEVELPDGTTVGDLRREIAKQIPLARTLLLRSNIAVNHEAAENEQPLQTADEVAVIPPVSGG